MVGFPVVELAHLNSSPRFGMGVCMFLDLFQDYLTLFFHRDRDVRACVHRGECMCDCLCYTVF
jgi:hypothetical protein